MLELVFRTNVTFVSLVQGLKMEKSINRFTLNRIIILAFLFMCSFNITVLKPV